MKHLLKKYYEPTPAKWRKIGDSLFVISTAAAAAPIVTGSPVLGTIFFFAGLVGKFLTNLFSEDSKNDK